MLVPYIYYTGSEPAGFGESSVFLYYKLTMQFLHLAGRILLSTIRNGIRKKAKKLQIRRADCLVEFLSKITIRLVKNLVKETRIKMLIINLLLDL